MKSEREIAAMDRKTFRAYALSLPPKQADEARALRRKLNARRWREEHPEQAREGSTARWHAWRGRMNKKEAAAHRARDAERKRRERATK